MKTPRGPDLEFGAPMVHCGLVHSFLTRNRQIVVGGAELQVQMHVVTLEGHGAGMDFQVLRCHDVRGKYTAVLSLRQDSYRCSPSACMMMVAIDSSRQAHCLCMCIHRHCNVRQRRFHEIFRVTFSWPLARCVLACSGKGLRLASLAGRPMGMK